ncbi:MAG: sigma-54-dependent Fis family transcriptional regulator, partial [Bacteroidales bacterium]|nr:sigma-54-dependent Fis family transcriptional regulator [Bacteroidales bacterium]
MRSRKSDIPELARHFLKKYTDKYSRPELSFSEQTLQKLENYAWPGNVRELQHSIEKAVILSESPVLQPSDFVFRSGEATLTGRYEGTLEEMER